MAPEPLDEGWLEAVAAVVEAVDASGAADGVAQITVSGAPGGAAAFCVVVEAGRVSVAAGRHPQPDLVAGWTYPEFVQAWQGELSVDAAYMSGRMKLEGDQVLLFDGWRPLLRSTALREAVASLR
ncbi:MAG: SCP2 sterol-binding domain-containing protein [Acidimicrobiaceae bacterium]|nr:SCP2 sterol-binding domain-containing protein [Acidimicrobiaceae bacterium]